MSDETRQSAPWIGHCRKMQAFFAGDEDVYVGTFDPTDNSVKVYVRGSDKAEAIGGFLKSEVEFGGVKLRVNVVPDNDAAPTTEEMLIRAFGGNPLFAGTAVEEEHGGIVTYAVFEPEAVQYWNDNIGSCYGVETYTAEDVARDIFDMDAFICSDVKAMVE